MLSDVQTACPLEPVERSVHDWPTADQDEINHRPAQPEDGKPPPDEAKAPLAEDRSLGFAQAVHQHMKGALFRCEEHYPQDGPNSVLYVVVERDAAQWRERLNTLHHDYFCPGQSDSLAPVQLEVIDRATHDALQRLVAAGLVARTTRATRSLWPADESTTSPPPLSEAEREKAGVYRRRRGS